MSGAQTLAKLIGAGLGAWYLVDAAGWKVFGVAVAINVATEVVALLVKH